MQYILYMETAFFLTQCSKARFQATTKQAWQTKKIANFENGAQNVLRLHTDTVQSWSDINLEWGIAIMVHMQYQNILFVTSQKLSVKCRL